MLALGQLVVASPAAALLLTALDLDLQALRARFDRSARNTSSDKLLATLDDIATAVNEAQNSA